MSFFSEITESATPLKFFAMNNQEFKVGPEIVNVNSNEPEFYLFNIKTSKYSGSCNNINDPYAEVMKRGT